MIIKKYRTDVCIDDDKFPNDDWDFIQKRGFKPTHLLRSKIKELREQEEGAPDNKTLLENIKRLKDNLEKALNFLQEKGLLDNYLNK